MRTCYKCGAEVEYIKVASGQRVPVNPGWVMVATGTGNTGGVTQARIVHWLTCSKDKPARLSR